MGNKPVISKQQILDTAFAIASESGLSGLSIREVARACNVAVGTVYNSYPTKYDLVNDVVGRFWNEALADSMPGAIAGDDFIGFCEGLALQLSGALARFRDDWLTEVAALDAKGLHRRASARRRASRTSAAASWWRSNAIRTWRTTACWERWPPNRCARSCGTACSRPSNEAIPDAKPCSPSCAARCTSPHSHEIMQQYERRPTCSI
mgnify:CR=1 FL=1